MPINIITANTTATIYNLSSIYYGFVVMPGVSVSHGATTVIVDVGPALDITQPLNLQVFGTVVCLPTAVYVQNAITVLVGAEGLVSSVTGTAISINNQGGATAALGLSSVTNHGVIHGGQGQAGIDFTSQFAVVTNTGLIDGGAQGVRISGLGASVVNSGSISAAAPGAVNAGVWLNGAAGAHLSNSGLIEAVGTAGSAGVQVNGPGDAKIVNDGTIRSPTGWGIWANALAEVTNMGRIEGNFGHTGSIWLGRLAAVWSTPAP